MKELAAKMDKTNGDLDGRVTKLEAYEKHSEIRFKNIDEDIEKLKKKLQHLIDNMSKPSEGGTVDMSAIQIQITAMKEDIQILRTDDLNALRIELKAYADK